MNQNEPIVEFKNVGLSFGTTPVHRNLNFTIGAGEGLTILGPSGIGKTIILKLIMGLLLPTKGEVRIMGSNLSEKTEEQRREIRKQVGMLFQGAALFDSLTVFENIAFSLREFGEQDETRIAQIVADRLSVIGLSGIEKKTPSQLSGGQKKRVGLARALASSPRIMLFDEPTTGLDPTATRLIDDLIIKLKTEMGMTCISVTHDIESAKRISDRWILINTEGVLSEGTVSELLAHNRPVQDFVSGNWDEELHAGGK